MPVTLCLDFGNTRLKAAVFSGKKFEKEILLEDDSEKTAQALFDEYHPGKVILSSVIDHNPALETFFAGKTKFHRLGHLSKLPLSIAVGKPETIGADRLALSVAAISLYPGKNNLVIGLGSAVTYNFINKNGEFLGGGISPGMEMRFKALHSFTAKLPLVKPDWNFPLVGYDTRTNILSGVIFGMAGEIDGTIDAYKEKYDNFNVALSGGDLDFFAGRLKNKTFADPHLIYKGLYAISEYNQ
ncbi:MAG TPA: type III pantothenate kinase [Puia sp.]|nr:type III pantothenate kinase [Puia sp.]